MKKKKAKTTLIDSNEKYAEIGDMYTSRWRKLDLLIPSNFRMLCAILNVKPERILMDFMWKLSYSVIHGATEKQRKAGKKFFIEGGFGQPAYTKQDIKKMFNELKYIRKLTDTTEAMEDENKELFWKNNHMYVEFWYKRWFEKNSRLDELSVLDEY
ncbi:hypothetical protein [Algoriphagus yeomjeoni]|uniref:Uncharacterized protein n=1 Tax=Algoriphagus yeomjeoni TaxID=291403 RepID=A0A327PJ49_9BACT|nr:hypothetical protein [Algoriphagus yeomjeoni]RAI92208.1 hypothetical protein LV83_01437 [Algoriphagus yeomjeoni]